MAFLGWAWSAGVCPALLPLRICAGVSQSAGVGASVWTPHHPSTRASSLSRSCFLSLCSWKHMMSAGVGRGRSPVLGNGKRQAASGAATEGALPHSTSPSLR